VARSWSSSSLPPDFIVRLAGDGGRYLTLETKGYDKLAEVEKRAASRWVAAVNAEGNHGRWQFVMVRRIGDVRDALTAANGPISSSSWNAKT
jgi:hypothetical protein